MYVCMQSHGSVPVYKPFCGHEEPRALGSGAPSSCLPAAPHLAYLQTLDHSLRATPAPHAFP